MWSKVSASREMAALLATRDIAPRKVRLEDSEDRISLQGYRLEDFGTAWDSLDRADAARAAEEAAELAAGSGGSTGSGEIDTAEDA
jgi:hypothetical protein